MYDTYYYGDFIYRCRYWVIRIKCQVVKNYLRRILKKLGELKNSEFSKNKKYWLSEVINSIVNIGAEMDGFHRIKETYVFRFVPETRYHFKTLNEYASKFVSGKFSQWLNAMVVSLKKDIIEYRRKEGVSLEDLYSRFEVCEYCNRRPEGHGGKCGYNGDGYDDNM